jgi:hypothetical protein
MCKKAEVIPEGKKGILMYPVPAFIVQIGKYASVFPQQPMNIPDKVVCITVKSVIVIVSALIRAEFLIGTATYDRAAIETFPFHSTNVLIKIQKIISNTYKRI